LFYIHSQLYFREQFLMVVRFATDGTLAGAKRNPRPTIAKPRNLGDCLGIKKQQLAACPANHNRRLCAEAKFQQGF
jgi:hypothetical protein